MSFVGDVRWFSLYRRHHIAKRHCSDAIYYSQVPEPSLRFTHIEQDLNGKVIHHKSRTAHQLAYQGNTGAEASSMAAGEIATSERWTTRDVPRRSLHSRGLSSGEEIELQTAAQIYCQRA